MLNSNHAAFWSSSPSAEENRYTVRQRNLDLFFSGPVWSRDHFFCCGLDWPWFQRQQMSMIGLDLVRSRLELIWPHIDFYDWSGRVFAFHTKNWVCCSLHWCQKWDGSNDHETLWWVALAKCWNLLRFVGSTVVNECRPTLPIKNLQTCLLDIFIFLIGLCIVPYFTLIYSTKLYSIVLYWIKLDCPVPYCALLY